MTDRKYKEEWKHRGEDVSDATGHVVGYIQHDVSTIFFAFGPYSDAPPMEQYDYADIYEYVDYLEMALIELRYASATDVRAARRESFGRNIHDYARKLEQIAWDNDANAMTSFEERDWFNPLRRIQQMEVGDAIAFLETHLLSTYTEAQLLKLHGGRISDESYLLALTQMTHHVQHTASGIARLNEYATHFPPRDEDATNRWWAEKKASYQREWDKEWL